MYILIYRLTTHSKWLLYPDLFKTIEEADTKGRIAMLGTVKGKGEYHIGRAPFGVSDEHYRTDRGPLRT